MEAKPKKRSERIDLMTKFLLTTGLPVRKRISPSLAGSHRLWPEITEAIIIEIMTVKARNLL